MNWYLLLATALVGVSAALIVYDVYVWKKSPRHLGEALIGLSVGGLILLIISMLRS